MYRFSQLTLAILLVASTAVLQAQGVPGGIGAAARQNNAQRTDESVMRIDDRFAFTVKQVDPDVVYIEGGKNRGLDVGMTLTIKRSGRYLTASGDEVKANIIVGILEVTSVSSTSAMCQIHARNQEIRKGDIAWISSQDQKHKPAQPAVAGTQPAPAPLVGQPSPQASARGFWTTPEQRPQPVAPAPGLSIAERAQMATGYPAPSLPPRPPSVSAAPAPPATIAAPQPTPAATSLAVAQAAPPATNPVSSSASTTPTATASSSPAPLPPLNVPLAPTTNDQSSGQTSASQPALSVGERARLARAEREARVRAAQAAPAQPQPTTQTAAATGGLTPSSAGTAVSPANATSAASVASAGSSVAPVNTPSQPSSSTIATTTPGVQSQVPAAPAKPAAAPVVVASGGATPGQPPVSSPKPAPIQATASVASNPQTQAFTASAANTAFKTSVPAAPVTPVSSPSTVAAAPASSVMTASLSKMPPVGSVAADAIPLIQAAGPTLPANVKTSFKIKYVAEDAVYIEGGKDAGLVEGMTLEVERPPAPGAAVIDAGKSIAEVAVVSVSNTSAVCEIRSKTTDLQRGDMALLSQADQEKLAQATTLGPARKYPQVIAFSEGDPLDEEQREAVPKPPLPEVNRARGRIGLDYTYINSTGAATLNTSQIGGVIRVDMTRIGGTYWNLNGYWRGRMNTLTSSSSTQPQSVYDLVNRTYTLGLTYVNPNSGWTAGVGRLFLPWATSLDTFDGGYLGRRFGKHTIIGAFAGTSPDPTSFNYNPDLRTAGSFVAFEAGSFDGLRFTSTEGIAVSGIEWQENRQFIFNETGLFYKRFLSIYNATQADKQHTPSGGIEQGLARSFSTMRLQPWKFISFDVNHNYFRDVPTFSTALISTGLVDKFLFQGLSAGVRLDLPGRIGLYSNFGQSSRTGDTHNSLNQLYGITLGRLWFTGIRADVRYSKFASSFGSGNYRAFTLSRSFKERLRLEVNAGKQAFISSLAVPSDYKLLGSTLELNMGSHYFIETAFNVQRGLQQNYDQWITTMGYRFDTKRGR